MEFIVADDRPLSMRFPRLIEPLKPRYVTPNQPLSSRPNIFARFVNSSRNAWKIVAVVIFKS